MNKTRLIAGIILIFILGGLAGALTVRLFDHPGFRDGPPRHRTPAERTDFIMARLDDDLDLTPEQIIEIRPIVEKGEAEMTEIMERIDPEMRKIHDQGFAAIREKLSPEQQLKLDELRERLEKHRKRKEPERK